MELEGAGGRWVVNTAVPSTKEGEMPNDLWGCFITIESGTKPGGTTLRQKDNFRLHQWSTSMTNLNVSECQNALCTVPIMHFSIN